MLSRSNGSGIEPTVKPMVLQGEGREFESKVLKGGRIKEKVFLRFISHYPTLIWLVIN